MNDTLTYLTALETDPDYVVARMRKLRREYGRVFAGPWTGRQRKLNELADEMGRHERTMVADGTRCLVCFAPASATVDGRPSCADHIRYGTNA